MRMLITGGAGFLGSHLAESLLAQGYHVVCMDNLCTGKVENIAHLLGRDGFSFIKYNVCDYVHIDGPLDAVLHFASPASPQDYLDMPIATLKVGGLGTHKVLGLAKAKGARFLLASTSEVYGDPLVNPQPESYWGNVSPVSPRGVYDEAKRFAEATVSRPGYAHRPHLQHVWSPHAAERRARGLEFHRAGPPGQTVECLWKRVADAELLLRR